MANTTLFFPTRNELQRDVVDAMNRIFGQNCFQMKDTDKYVKITCLQKCMWESWFYFDSDPLTHQRYNMRFYRCIQQNHLPGPH